MTRITIIDGHPDPNGTRYVHALADAYAAGGEAAGHEVRRGLVPDRVTPCEGTRPGHGGRPDNDPFRMRDVQAGPG